MHVIKEKCFNRVHSFTLAGKHQMHLVRELLQRLCLHKEPEMLILGIYCLHCVAQNLEILVCCFKKAACKYARVHKQNMLFSENQFQNMFSLSPLSYSNCH